MEEAGSKRDATRSISAWAITPQGVNHELRPFSLLESGVPHIPKNADTSLYRYAQRFTNIIDVPFNPSASPQKTLASWLVNLCGRGFVRPDDLKAWEKEPSAEKAMTLLAEGGIDALRFQRPGSSWPGLAVVSLDKIKPISRFDYRRTSDSAVSMQWLDKNPTIQVLTPDSGIFNLSAGGSVIKAACDKCDPALVKNPHVVALALAQFLGGEKSGAQIAVILNNDTGRPVWVTATFPTKKSSEGLPVESLFLDRSGARKKEDLITQISAGVFGKVEALTPKQGIPLDSRIHEPVKAQAEKLARELASHLPPADAVAYLFNLSAPGALPKEIKHSHAWARRPEAASVEPRMLSILDTSMPEESAEGTNLVRYRHRFENVFDVPDNDFMPLKDSLLIWLQHLASEGVIPPHKFLDWEISGTSTKTAITILTDAGIDALRFVREDTGTQHLVAINMEKIEVLRSYDYAAQLNIFKPIENVERHDSVSQLTGNSTTPLLNKSAGGAAIQNACSKIESPFIHDPHATALALAQYLGGEEKGAGIGAIINIQTGKPVWITATIGDYFLDKNGASKKKDLAEQIKSGIFGPPDKLSARQGIPLSSAIHRPAILKAQSLLQELRRKLPPAEAIPLLLTISVPGILEEDIGQPCHDISPENHPAPALDSMAPGA